MSTDRSPFDMRPPVPRDVAVDSVTSPGVYYAWCEVAIARLDAAAAVAGDGRPAVLVYLDALGRMAVGFGLALRRLTPLDLDGPDEVGRIVAARPDQEAPGVGSAMGRLRDLLTEPLPEPGPARCYLGRRLVVAGHDLRLLASTALTFQLLAARLGVI